MDSERGIGYEGGGEGTREGVRGRGRGRGMNWYIMLAEYSKMCNILDVGRVIQICRKYQQSTDRRRYFILFSIQLLVF